MPQEKRALRAKIRAILQALPPDERLEKSARAQRRLIETPEFRSARTVMAYCADATEVDTRELILACLARGKQVGLPRLKEDPQALRVLEIHDFTADLEPGRFGFQEPRAQLPELTPEALDLIVVPGRAFDLLGDRLGRGGGYYDRLLARDELHACAAALAFESQVVNTVPREQHDRPVALIVTESRVIRARE